MLNSYVANYLVRMRVGTHVTAAIIVAPAGAAGRDRRGSAVRGVAERGAARWLMERNTEAFARAERGAARLYA